MRRRSRIVGATVGVVSLVGVGLAVITGGGDDVVMAGGHTDTALDASTSTTPPTDWRRGYSRTGTVCYTQDATGSSAVCFAADVLPYTVDATDTGWPIEPAQTNRFPVNQGGACGGLPWVCSTATMDSTSADPAGGTTASSITFGGGTVDATAFGFTPATAIDLRLYAKCPGGGTLDASHVGGTGHWTVDATAMGTGWNLLYPAQSEVTEAAVMTSDASGYLRLRLSGVDCTIWGVTATEAPAYPRSTRWLGTIPTTDATGSTVGATVWTVDNSSGAYWAASGVTKVETGTVHNGTCWSYTAPTITLSGASTCHGIRYALGLTWGSD